MSSVKLQLNRDAAQIETSDRFAPCTAVSVKPESNSDIEYIAGDIEGGRVLYVVCPYASQTMAENILQQVYGYAYQPYEARSALVEPAAEIGDAVSIGGVYSGIFTQEIAFSRLLISDISAPQDEELTHEFGYFGGDGKYATYASLASGTAAVNGAGLQSGTVTSEKMSEGVSTSLGYAEYAMGVLNNLIAISALKVNQLGEVTKIIDASEREYSPLLLNVGGTSGYVFISTV